MAAVDLQLLERGPDRIVFGWDPQDLATVTSFNIYAALTDTTGSYLLLKTHVANIPTAQGPTKGRVSVTITETELQALAGFSAATFEITPLYFRTTTVSPSNVESAIASSLSRPLNIEKSAPSGRYGTAYGAQLVSMNPLYDDSYTIERTFSGSDVATEIYYLTGSPVGSRAKKIVYTGPYQNGKATKVEIFDIPRP